jgi:hypothetical protein
MNYPGPNSQYTFARRDLPPRGPRTGLYVALGVVVLLIVLVVYGAISVFHAAANDMSAAKVVANRFIAATGTHHYNAALGLCAPDLQANMSQTKLAGIESKLEQNSGSYLSAKPTSWFIQKNNGITQVRLIYAAEYSKGPVTVSLMLVENSVGYQVEGFNYSLSLEQ